MPGPDLPPIVYGTAWKKDRTAALVEQAVRLGFRGIDTACQPKHYSEAGVGEALRSLAEKGVSRDSIFLQTKFTSLDGQDPARVPYDPDAPLADQVAQSFAASLKNLGTNVLDSWVLHSPMRTYEDTRTVWKAMEEVHRAGGARALGLSNCYEVDLFGSPVVQGLARSLGKTPAQVLFRYLNQRGVVPLTGTTSELHMKEDLAFLEFELSPRGLDDMDALL